MNFVFATSRRQHVQLVSGPAGPRPGRRQAPATRATSSTAYGPQPRRLSLFILAQPPRRRAGHPRHAPTRVAPSRAGAGSKGAGLEQGGRPSCLVFTVFFVLVYAIATRLRHVYGGYDDTVETPWDLMHHALGRPLFLTDDARAHGAPRIPCLFVPDAGHGASRGGWRHG